MGKRKPPPPLLNSQKHKLPNLMRTKTPNNQPKAQSAEGMKSMALDGITLNKDHRKQSYIDDLLTMERPPSEVLVRIIGKDAGQFGKSKSKVRQKHNSNFNINDDDCCSCNSVSSLSTSNSAIKIIEERRYGGQFKNDVAIELDVQSISPSPVHLIRQDSERTTHENNTTGQSSMSSLTNDSHGRFRPPSFHKPMLQSQRSRRLLYDVQGIQAATLEDHDPKSIDIHPKNNRAQPWYLFQPNDHDANIIHTWDGMSPSLQHGMMTRAPKSYAYNYNTSQEHISNVVRSPLQLQLPAQQNTRQIAPETDDQVGNGFFAYIYRKHCDCSGNKRIALLILLITLFSSSFVTIIVIGTKKDQDLSADDIRNDAILSLEDNHESQLSLEETSTDEEAYLRDGSDAMNATGISNSPSSSPLEYVYVEVKRSTVPSSSPFSSSNQMYRSTTSPSFSSSSESPTSQRTLDPSHQPSIASSVIPSQQFTELPTSISTPLPSYRPSQYPIHIQSKAPSTIPSYRPSQQPSIHLTPRPSLHPSPHPSQLTLQPIAHTDNPTRWPTEMPTSKPSHTPSGAPSKSPTMKPTTLAPSNTPSLTESFTPSHTPSTIPSEKSTTLIPSQTLTLELSSAPPSNEPTRPLSTAPTSSPTSFPSLTPTILSSSSPSTSITNEPTSLQPSLDPTVSPTSTLAPSSSHPTSRIPKASSTPSAIASSSQSIPTVEPSDLSVRSQLPSSTPTSLPTQEELQSPTSSPLSIASLNPTVTTTSYAPTYAPTYA